MTFIQKQMGKDFDPELHCPYTGKALHQFPMLGGPGNSDPLASASMGYWREDGELMRCRPLTRQEAAWITGNPEAFKVERAEFESWLRPHQERSELAYQERVKKLVDAVK
jgi:hypothetical protein